MVEELFRAAELQGWGDTSLSLKYPGSTRRGLFSHHVVGHPKFRIIDLWVTGKERKKRMVG